MSLITLKEWAKKNKMSRRKAEYLAKLPGFPAKKERRPYRKMVWVTVVPDDFKPEQLSS